jgi:hypothetical protein
MVNAEGCCRELEEALCDDELFSSFSSRIHEKKSGDFTREEGYRQWAEETGLDDGDAVLEACNKIIRTLSLHLSNGLMQVTIETLIQEKDPKDAVQFHRDVAVVTEFSKKLESFTAYIDVIAKTGYIELSKFRFEFEVEPFVTVKDAKLIFHNGKLNRISFGEFNPSLKISLVLGKTREELCRIEKKMSLPGPIEVGDILS